MEEAMSWIRRVIVLKIALLTVVEVMAWADPASAQAALTAKVTHVYADPGDFVIALDKAGYCGSNYFHVRRANTNFQEMVAVMLKAFQGFKSMIVFITGCAGNRNIISHGGAASGL
jgi:hypothetical protein